MTHSFPTRRSSDLIAHRLVLGVDVVHEHRYGLVARQLHAHFGRHARIGNVGRRAMADAVRSDVWDAGGLEHPAPAAIVLAKGQVLGRVVGRRQDVGAALTARRRRKQPIGFLARSEENTSELQSLLRTTSAVFGWKKKK